MKHLRARIDATALRLVGGLALLDAAAWGTWGWQAGLAAAGASLLLLDFLSGDEQGATT
jgi:hypothetical protein